MYFNKAYILNYDLISRTPLLEAVNVFIIYAVPVQYSRLRNVTIKYRVSVK